MKRIKIYLVALLGLLGTFACEDDRTKEVINLDNPVPAVITSPVAGSTIELILASADTDSVQFAWNEADFGSQVPRNYTVQLDQEGTDFKKAIRVAITADTKCAMKVADLNLALYNLGIQGGVSTNMALRVLTSVKEVDTVLSSDIVAISIKPFAYNKPQITNLSNGDSFVLDTTNGINWLTINWDPVQYGAALGQTYTLQFDLAGNNFSKPVELYKGSNHSFTPTIKAFNAALILKELEGGKPADIDFRVLASISSSSGWVYSDVVTIKVTPYAAEVSKEIAPIYMLGGATTAGWSNNSGNIVAYYQPSSGADSTFTAVDYLKPNGVDGSDGLVKFVRYIGMWAPQWGCDGAGTWASGNLVLRPTESVPDPAAIPAPDVAGDYLVSADIVNLKYTMVKVAETLHLIGDATAAGWDNTQAIPLTKDGPGKFSIVAHLDASASEGFKFLVNQGAWEPMYGQDGNGTWETGYLKYRPVGAADVKSIPPPATTGDYLIEVDFSKNMYHLTLQ